MSWCETFIWILTIFGVSNGIANSALLYPFRIWVTFSDIKDEDNPKLRKWELPGKLVSCVMCLGFWFGLLAGIIWQSPTGMFILDGFFGSATSWILYLFIHNKQTSN